MPDNRAIALAGRRHLGWSPRPLSPPAVDPALTDLHPVVRAAEVVRYSGTKLEYWISPGGHAREVVRMSLLLFALLAPPVLVVMPLVTGLLVQVAGWAELLTKIAGNIVGLVLALIIGRLLLKMFVR